MKVLSFSSSDCATNGSKVGRRGTDDRHPVLLEVGPGTKTNNTAEWMAASRTEEGGTGTGLGRLGVHF